MGSGTVIVQPRPIKRRLLETERPVVTVGRQPSTFEPPRQLVHGIPQRLYVFFKIDQPDAPDGSIHSSIVIIITTSSALPGSEECWNRISQQFITAELFDRTVG